MNYTRGIALIALLFWNVKYIQCLKANKLHSFLFMNKLYNCKRYW